MPTLPWTTPNPVPPGTDVLVFASRFETRTLWGAFRFLLRTPGVWRHAPSAGGLSGQMRDAKYARWEVPGEALPLDWAEARRRLG
ncbi:hypothetical protein ACI3K4_22055 [Streptomyces sp. CSMPJR101]|uniref:hypothetical protein n=1 Tax=Streptomyces sp. CSMPJR101 TaxID=1279378 RepID=UPI00385189AA